MTDAADRIAIACDHAGFLAKERLKASMQMRGLSVVDCGTESEDRVDYPEYGRKVAESVSRGEVRRGVLICGTGLGMSYTANRYPNVRAALCWSVEAAHLARTHNDANVLVLPGRVATMDPLEDILAAWLETPFSEDERHARRIRQIDGEDAD